MGIPAPRFKLLLLLLITEPSELLNRPFFSFVTKRIKNKQANKLNTPETNLFIYSFLFFVTKRNMSLPHCITYYGTTLNLAQLSRIHFYTNWSFILSHDAFIDEINLSIEYFFI